MEKEQVKKVIKDYLKIFPNEIDRLKPLIKYVKNTNDNLMCDWNNINGHFTAGAFIYSKQTRRFLVLWHKDLKMFLYAGGHCEQNHRSTLETAKLEVIEETGIIDFSIKSITENEDVPIDIDIHSIPYNSRVNMPEHYHFDFRYIFFVNDESDVRIDENEISNYKWIDEKELKEDKNYGLILKKLKFFL